MNSASPAEQAVSDSRTSAVSAEPVPTPRQNAMLTWQGVSEAQLGAVRLVFGEQGRFRASGRLVVAAGTDREAHSAEFELHVDEEGAVRRVLLCSSTVGYERQVSLARSDDGVWLVDDGSGATRGQFDGAVDVDIQDVMLTHSVPIRRLGLHRTPGQHTLPVIFVSLPELSAKLVEQTYRTVSVEADHAVIEYSCGSSPTELTVDTDGVVLDYPGLMRRV